MCHRKGKGNCKRRDLRIRKEPCILGNDYHFRPLADEASRADELLYSCHFRPPAESCRADEILYSCHFRPLAEACRADELLLNYHFRPLAKASRADELLFNYHFRLPSGHTNYCTAATFVRSRKLDIA